MKFIAAIIIRIIRFALVIVGLPLFFVFAVIIWLLHRFSELLIVKIKQEV